jgi:hypothetical protein
VQWVRRSMLYLLTSIKLQVTDGNYSSDVITFVTTRTDDVQPSEISRAVRVPVIVAVEKEIKAAERRLAERKKVIDDIRATLKGMCSNPLCEYT